jgi:adenylate kinase family enzyme
MLNKERVYLKLLRVCDHAQDGFVLTDFPTSTKQAELLEEFRGGLNAFVHITLPDDILMAIEDTKIQCGGCGRHYYPDGVHDIE